MYKSKNQTITAIDNINLEIRKNELVLIKGRSGSGKSTLMNLMSGLIKPTAGKVLMEGDCISNMPDAHLSRLLSDKIGIIFQSFNLLPAYTIYENIEMAIVPGRTDKSLLGNNIFSLLDRFGLGGKAGMLPSELSAGQQQKVAIVRTLIKEPSVLFADEPTGSVDDETASEIMDYLLSIKKEKRLTVVIATHGNISEKIADRVVLLQDGRIRNHT